MFFTAKYSAPEPNSSQPYLDTPSSSPYTEGTGNLLNLDYLPYGHLEGAIYNLQSSLSPGSSFTFEFTTLGPSVKFLDQRFVLCAIPFLPRKCMQSKDMAPRRSAAPLLTSLHRVI